MFMQVKYSTDAEFPASYPAQCRETDTGVLEPGFDAVMTVAQFKARKAQLDPQVNAVLDAREAEAEAAGKQPMNDLVAWADAARAELQPYAKAIVLLAERVGLSGGEIVAILAAVER